jgi:hypothetical protein
LSNLLLIFKIAIHQIHYQLPNDHQPHHHQLDQPDEESHQLHHESDHQEESEIEEESGIEEEYDFKATAAVHVRLAAETELLKVSHESKSSIQYG